MHKYCRNANFHLFSFIRYGHWPFYIPLIVIAFLIFCPQLTQSLKTNEKDSNQINENPDRTVAKLGSRELQLTTTSSPAPVSVPATASTKNFDEYM